MNDMMNPKRCGDRNGQRSKDDGVVNDDYEGPVFDDDPYEEEIEEVAEGSEILEAMFPLLEEFSDVFLDEFPDALLPLCDIQHHIDLEPSPVFDDDPYEEEIVSEDVGVNLVFKDELEMGDDAFVLIEEEVAEGSEILEAMFLLLEEFSDVFLDERRYALSFNANCKPTGLILGL
nr:hypothetical protein [Tanacetum cinerariifolium]